MINIHLKRIIKFETFKIAMELLWSQQRLNASIEQISLQIFSNLWPLIICELYMYLRFEFVRYQKGYLLYVKVVQTTLD